MSDKTSTPVICVCATYDPDAEEYENVEAFEECCWRAHGMVPDLRWQEAHTIARGAVRRPAGWYEGDVLVLELATAGGAR